MHSKLAQEVEAHEKKVAMMQKYTKIDSPVISFNVGGIYFSTLNST